MMPPPMTTTRARSGRTGTDDIFRAAYSGGAGGFHVYRATADTIAGTLGKHARCRADPALPALRHRGPAARRRRPARHRDVRAVRPGVRRRGGRAGGAGGGGAPVAAAE